MSDGDIYLWYNRIMKQKDVDNYLNKIGTWHEDISLKKLAVILSILCVCGAALGTHVFLKKHDKKTETHQTEKVKPSHNSTKTILYNSVSGYTR